MKRNSRGRNHSGSQASALPTVALIQQPIERPRIPFRERPSCTVEEASEAGGIGRTKRYELIAEGRLETFLIGRRRLIRVPSLLRLLELDQAAA